MGLALIAIQRGYKLICTMSDKQSKEKIDILKAMGVKVHICPTELMKKIIQIHIILLIKKIEHRVLLNFILSKSTDKEIKSGSTLFNNRS